ncbi:MAG: GNAT family N-acetyltransferase [Caulobacterales bacterium]|nr:GNAT family N-acetyltransferase [Caulobacterales bacterium]
MTLIRPLTPEDAAIYHALRLEALGADADSFATSLEEQAGRSLEQVARTLSETTVFGAFIDDELVGTAGFARNAPVKEAHKGVVWGMYLRASARGSGLAGALLDSVIAYARGKVEQLTLIVVSDNRPAVRLYESRGFMRWGLEPRALKLADGRYTVDGYYWLPLTSPEA